MSRLIDLTGKRFGRLTVLYRVPTKNRKTLWRCRCDCGNETIVQGGNLASGHTQSCGDCKQIVQRDGYMECIVKSGRTFKFDAEDIALIEKHSWNVDSKGYVRGNIDGKGVKLHRYLMQAEDDMVVDHINSDPSDCRRSNLRVTTQLNNTYNAKLSKNSTTGYKGVCWDKRYSKYMAHIHPNRTMRFLGYFDTAVEAALAYDRAALKYFGEFAKTNFGEGGIYGPEVLEMESA